jgi:hypothetical protein
MLIRIGLFRRLDMILKLADEEQKDQIFGHSAGYNCQT